METKKVWIVCKECGDYHKLFPGIHAPQYWCESTLVSLKEGDEVEYEDNQKRSQNKQET